MELGKIEAKLYGSDDMISSKFQTWICEKMSRSKNSEAAAWGCPQASFSPSPPWPSPCLCKCCRAETQRKPRCLFHLSILLQIYMVLQYVVVFLIDYRYLSATWLSTDPRPGQGRFTGTGIWANRFLRLHPPNEGHEFGVLPGGFPIS